MKHHSERKISLWFTSHFRLFFLLKGRSNNTSSALTLAYVQTGIVSCPFQLRVTADVAEQQLSSAVYQ